MSNLCTNPVMSYDRWKWPMTRLGSKARPQNRLLPVDVLTCWEVNTVAGAQSTWTLNVATCGACVLFHGDKDLLCHLRQLESNKEAPKRYRCETPWIAATTSASSKRKSPSTETLTPPKKNKKKASEIIVASPLAANNPPPVAPSTPPPADPPPARSTPPQYPEAEGSETLTAYLLRRLAFKEEALQLLEHSNEELVLEVEALREQNGFFNTSTAELQQLANEVNFELDESKRQVTYLKRLLKRKVASLTLVVDQKKTVELALEEKTVSELVATTLLSKRLQELLVEKSLVANLKMELATAYVRHLPLPETLDDLASSVEQLVSCTTRKGSHLNTKVRIICDMMLTTLFDGKCRTYLLHKAKGLVQRENPYRRAMTIAKVIDLGGSVLNLSGYDQLRKGVEGNIEGHIERNGGWLASKWFVMKAMTAVETAAQAVIPFSPLGAAELEDGIDGIQFEYAPFLAYVLKLFQLDEVARDPNAAPVQFSITLDGADLSRNISHVTAGIKINDPRAKDPISGIPIGFEDSTKVQSRELCFPCKILIAKDTKELYSKYFKDFFAFFKQVETAGFGEFQRPFLVSSPQDLSSLWKCYDKGGACKLKKEFCHLCACLSDVCHKPRQVPCERCVLHGRDKCYHWVVGDEATLVRAEARLQSMYVTHPYLSDETVSARLRLHIDDNQLNATRDMQNINYCPLTSNERQRFSEQFLNHDLLVLGLSLMSDMELRRARVRSVLRTYEVALSMARTVEAGNYAGAYISIRQGVPCILHLENRCGEKFLKMLLLEGYDALPTDTLKNQFLKDFEEVVNTSVLGSANRRANWRLAVGKDKDNRQCIKDQTLPNTHVRKFLAKFDLLAALCITSLTRRADWEATILLWNGVMQSARRRDDFNDDDIEEFQSAADDWFEKWIQLVGRDGLTNYTHIVGAGHLSFYMREWGNLYRYSQQGWEAYNSLIKSVYYRRTQRGGHAGKKDAVSSRVVPLARWMQRKMFFLSGDYLQCDNGIGY
jgi:hypothetical protein